MRERKSARLLVVSPDSTVLLFRFLFKDGALAGQDYWATPGGGLEGEETFEVAAIRELREETGIRIDRVESPVATREFPMMMPDGEMVAAIEHYFVVRVSDQQLSRAEWTDHETQVMADHRWWSAQELQATQETVWPENLVEMLEAAGVLPVST